MHLNCFRTFTLALSFALGPGCVAADEDADWDPAQEADDGSVGLRLACDADVSASGEAEATALVEAFRTSLSEMIGCGRITADLAGGVRTGIAEAIIDGRPDATPRGWTYEGQGTYSTAGGQASMQTRFYLGADVTFGRAGDPIVHDVFRVDSYLVGARVRVPDPLSLSAEIHFERPGPLFELLGYGPDAASPLKVDLGTLGTIGNRLAGLHFESDIAVVEAAGDETIRYDLHTARMEANALLLGSGLVYEIDALVARTDQAEVVIEEWSAEFFTTGQVQGSTSFEVEVDAQWRCDGEIVFPELPRPSGD